MDLIKEIIITEFETPRVQVSTDKRLMMIEEILKLILEKYLTPEACLTILSKRALEIIEKNPSILENNELEQAYIE